MGRSVCPIITQKLLHRFASNQIGELCRTTGIFLARLKSSQLKRLTLMQKTSSKAVFPSQYCIYYLVSGILQRMKSPKGDYEIRKRAVSDPGTFSTSSPFIHSLLNMSLYLEAIHVPLKYGIQYIVSGTQSSSHSIQYLISGIL